MGAGQGAPHDRVAGAQSGRAWTPVAFPVRYRRPDRAGVEVLRLVARGLADAQIAEIPVISPRTVNAHPRSIYNKLDIPSRNAATYFALEHHLI